MKRAYLLFIASGIILMLYAGCQESPTSPTSSPTATTSPNLTPQPGDIVLAHATELAIGESFFLEVVNQGELPYIIYQPEGENCLNVYIHDAPTVYFPTSLPTCDVLSAIVVEPGQKRPLGNWDLMVCQGEDCLERLPAYSDTSYAVSIQVRPYYGDVRQIDASSEENEGPAFPVTAVFTVTK